MRSVVVPIANSGIVYDLTTVEAVNTELGIAGDTAADAATGEEITMYSKLIAEICDRVFAQQTVVETFRVYEHCLDNLPLTQYPVSQITSVVVNNVPVSDIEYELMNPENGLLYRIFGSWHGKIAVTYTGGYALPEDAPISLARAVIGLIEDARTFAAQSNAAGGSFIRDIQHGDRRVAFFDSSASLSKSNAALPASVADLIRPFRRIVT